MKLNSGIVSGDPLPHVRRAFFGGRVSYLFVAVPVAKALTVDQYIRSLDDMIPLLVKYELSNTLIEYYHACGKITDRIHDIPIPPEGQPRSDFPPAPTSNRPETAPGPPVTFTKIGTRIN